MAHKGRELNEDRQMLIDAKDLIHDRNPSKESTQGEENDDPNA